MKNLSWALPSLLLAGAISLTAIPSRSEPSDVLGDASHALNQISRMATPAVVSITSVKDSNGQLNPLDPHADPLGSMSVGIGSGVVMNASGTILTNEHVVKNAERVTVTFDGKAKLSAHLVGSDANTDLAVIQLDQTPSDPLTTLSFGDSDQIAVGDWAIAIGSPFGLNRSVTTGIISATGRAQLGVLDIEDFIQTDAAINPGNSGGPLLNTRGQVIGVNTAIFSQTGGFIGIGFAIPSKTAKVVYEELLHHGRVVRGWLGISAQDLDSELANYFKRSTNEGALVSQILPNGPADQANVKIGDVITRFGETPVQSASQLKLLVSKAKTGTQISIELSRDGKPKTLQVAVVEQPDNKKPVSKQQAGQAGLAAQTHPFPYFGISVEDIPREFTELFGIAPHSGALVSEIQPGGPAFEAGLTVGDIILTANQLKIRGAKDFFEFTKSLKKSEPAVLYIQKGPDQKVFVPVKVL